MGWRRRCGSVAAPLRGCVLAAPCRHPILNATNDKLFRRQDTSLDIRPARFAMCELERLSLFQNMTGYDQSLHLRSPFADLAKLRIPQVLFDRQVGAVAVAAVNLP